MQLKSMQLVFSSEEQYLNYTYIIKFKESPDVIDCCELWCNSISFHCVCVFCAVLFF